MKEPIVTVYGRPLSNDTIEELRRLRAPKVERLSVSVPAELADFARAAAEASGVTISAVVEYALRKYLDV